MKVTLSITKKLRPFDYHMITTPFFVKLSWIMIAKEMIKNKYVK